MTKKVKTTKGSGNVFKDLGLKKPKAEQKKADVKLKEHMIAKDYKRAIMERAGKDQEFALKLALEHIAGLSDIIAALLCGLAKTEKRPKIKGKQRET